VRWQRWIASTSVALLTLSAAVSQAVAGSSPCGPSVTTPVPQPTAAHLAAAGLSRFRFAPDDRRVDLVAPPFTNSTNVDEWPPARGGVPARERTACEASHHMAMRALHEGLARGDAVRGWLG
jgi:hypothetical protein